MTTKAPDQFSEYEVKESTVKFEGESETAMPLGCVGTLEETLNVKTITKDCEGVRRKTVVRPTGDGEIKFTLHMRWEAFKRMFGLISDGYAAGVYAYGRYGMHEHFCYTAKVKDEDGNIKLKAYPDCVVSTGIQTKIENGAEEVSEIEVTATTLADTYGNCMYQCFASDVTEDIANNWLQNFDHDLIVAAGE